MSHDTLLEIVGLRTFFPGRDGLVKAVDGADLTIFRGKVTCVLGESGCGKSVMARSVLQVLDPPGRIVSGSIIFRERSGESVDLAQLDPRGKTIREYRGKKIAMVFQDPMSAFSPVHSIGSQIIETILLHQLISPDSARESAIQTLSKVGIPNPEARLNAYPSQLSGGMLQRAMIALALSCKPDLLIADEPTTAIDVTTQSNILALLTDIREETGMTMMFITHDLGVVAEIADFVSVMYLGKVVEYGTAIDIFDHPSHPYTRALLAAAPRLTQAAPGRLASIRGMVPHPLERPTGCPFHPRCDEALGEICATVVPKRFDIASGHMARCHLHDKNRLMNLAPEAKQ